MKSPHQLPSCQRNHPTRTLLALPSLAYSYSGAEEAVGWPPLDELKTHKMLLPYIIRIVPWSLALNYMHYSQTFINTKQLLSFGTRWRGRLPPSKSKSNDQPPLSPPHPLQNKLGALAGKGLSHGPVPDRIVDEHHNHVSLPKGLPNILITSLTPKVFSFYPFSPSAAASPRKASHRQRPAEGRRAGAQQPLRQAAAAAARGARGAQLQAPKGQGVVAGAEVEVGAKVQEAGRLQVGTGTILLQEAWKAKISRDVLKTLRGIRRVMKCFGLGSKHTKMRSSLPHLPNPRRAAYRIQPPKGKVDWPPVAIIVQIALGLLDLLHRSDFGNLVLGYMFSTRRMTHLSAPRLTQPISG